jgi:hypothetical protein
LTDDYRILGQRPGFLVRRLHQIHLALFAEECKAFGVTPAQYSILTAAAARRCRFDGDARRKLVHATVAGQRLLARMDGPAQRAHERTVAALGPKERGAFIEALRQLVEAGAEFKNASPPPRGRRGTGEVGGHDAQNAAVI